MGPTRRRSSTSTAAVFPSVLGGAAAKTKLRGFPTAPWPRAARATAMCTRDNRGIAPAGGGGSAAPR